MQIKLVNFGFSQRNRAFLFCFSLTTIFSWADEDNQKNAQLSNKQLISAAPQQGESQGEKISPREQLYSKRAYVSHIEGRGIGYNQGYSSLGLFLADKNLWDDKTQGFVDGRGHLFNNGKWATNVGVGARYIRFDHKRIYGGNFYYDYRHDHGNFNQIGAGFEVLGCFWDFRLNGYLPVGSKGNSFDEKTFVHLGGFSEKCARRERAIPGIDAEFSTSMRNWKTCKIWDVTGALGPYYYYAHKTCGKEKDIFGGRARLSFEVYDYLNVEVRGTYDNQFGAIIQGILALSFPLGPRNIPTPGCYDKCSYDRMREIALQPVIRDEIIVLEKYCHLKTNF